MDSELIISILAATVQTGTPILFATLGEIITERSGVLNLGVEGLMIMGAFLAFIVQYSTGNPWLAMLAAGFGVALLGSIHGIICLIFQGNQIVSGLAITILGIGLADYLGTPFIGTPTTGFSLVSYIRCADIITTITSDVPSSHRLTAPPNTSPAHRPAFAPPPPRRSPTPAATTSSCASPWRYPHGSRRRPRSAGDKRRRSYRGSFSCRSWRNES